MNDSELLRYSRHIMLPQIDIQGQEAICASRVLIIGAGGLGSPVALYLASAGVGNLVIVDDDIVDLGNLQRQILHSEKTLGMNKAESAHKQISLINSTITVQAIPRRLNEQTLKEQVRSATVVVDCSDNFSTRKQVNEACYIEKAPLVSGAAIRMEGQLCVFDFRDETSPCYQCLYGSVSDENLTCSESGVLAPLVGIVGSMQAMESLKLITGAGEGTVGQLALYDGSRGQWRYLALRRDPECRLCGDG